MPISYSRICEEYESRQEFCGVAEDDGKNLYGTEEELYVGLLESLAQRYLKDRYSICVDIKHDDQVVYSFPRIACPRLIVEQLKLSTRKL